jgi:hypothetical protein
VSQLWRVIVIRQGKDGMGIHSFISYPKSNTDWLVLLKKGRLPLFKNAPNILGNDQTASTANM